MSLAHLGYGAALVLSLAALHDEGFAVRLLRRARHDWGDMRRKGFG